jgi:hypothetical protein
MELLLAMARCAQCGAAFSTPWWAPARHCSLACAEKGEEGVAYTIVPEAERCQHIYPSETRCLRRAAADGYCGQHARERNLEEVLPAAPEPDSVVEHPAPIAMPTESVPERTPPVPILSDDVRCTATTKSGERCRSARRSGSPYCHFHRGLDSPIEAPVAEAAEPVRVQAPSPAPAPTAAPSADDGRCPYLIDGVPCGKWAERGLRHCRVHLDYPAPLEAPAPAPAELPTVPVSELIAALPPEPPRPGQVSLTVHLTPATARYFRAAASRKGYTAEELLVRLVNAWCKQQMLGKDKAG